MKESLNRLTEQDMNTIKKAMRHEWGKIINNRSMIRKRFGVDVKSEMGKAWEELEAKGLAKRMGRSIAFDNNGTNHLLIAEYVLLDKTINAIEAGAKFWEEENESR